VAVFVTFAMLVRPYLLNTQGAAADKAPYVNVRAGFDITSPGSRLEFLRVRLVPDGKGGQVLDAFGNQGSSLMTSLAWADGLAEIPQGKTVSKGEWLKFIPFSGIL
jgi:molybdopterin molybdotransferase